MRRPIRRGPEEPNLEPEAVDPREWLWSEFQETPTLEAYEVADQT